MLTLFALLTTPGFAIDADGDTYDAVDDCDDTDPTIHPGGQEGVVADGLDQDCSGTPDDVVVCPGGGGAPSVQAGVDAAGNGFVVQLCEGHYRENVRIVGKQLELRSLGSYKKTGINGEQSGPALSVAGGAQVTLRDLTLFNGRSSDFGGGLRCAGSSVDVQHVRIMANDAVEGGGLGASACQVQVAEVLLADNVASGNGGNGWLDDSEGLVTGALIRGGLAAQGGGLFVSGGQVAIEQNTISDNTATSTVNEYVGGGGIHLSGDSTLTGNVLAGNHADMCGGGAYLDGAHGEVVGNVISGNTADDDGGGIYFDWSYSRFANNTVVDNDAVDDAGGLRIYYGDMTVEDNLIQGNTANDDGGGVKLSHADHVYRRNTHRDNHTGDAGGGLELDNDTSHVEDCVFEDNSAGRGGGLHLWRNEGLQSLRSSDFVGNHANDCGGAMAFDNDPFEVTLYDLSFVGNTSDDDGGTLCVQAREQDDGTSDESLLHMENSLVDGSDASDEGGFAKVEHGALAVDNSVIAGASAPRGSQGLADTDGRLSFRNTVLVDGSGQTVLDADDNGEVQVRYTDLFAQTGGFGAVGNPVGSNGNVSVDPLFMGGGDWRLQAGSPLIDAGDPSLSDPDGTVSDIGLHGGPRALP